MKNVSFALIVLLLLPVHAGSAEPERIQVGVTGLACPFCAYSVEKNLSKLPGVKNVEVNLAKNQVAIVMQADHSIDIEAIKQAIVNSGFTPGDVSSSVAKE